MAKAKKATVRIRWVRSAIGFSNKQQKILESLGLRRLRHVVERPDGPETRGLIARVSHLVEVVGEREGPSWASIPEYRILPPKTGPGLEPPPEELQAAVVAADSEATAAPESAAEAAREPETEAGVDTEIREEETLAVSGASKSQEAEDPRGGERANPKGRQDPEQGAKAGKLSQRNRG
jgi:large subunit ribosomal protein L30